MAASLFLHDRCPVSEYVHWLRIPKRGSFSYIHMYVCVHAYVCVSVCIYDVCIYMHLYLYLYVYIVCLLCAYIHIHAIFLFFDINKGEFGLFMAYEDFILAQEKYVFLTSL